MIKINAHYQSFVVLKDKKDLTLYKNLKGFDAHITHCHSFTIVLSTEISCRIPRIVS